jgi:hypothetical protein
VSATDAFLEKLRGIHDLRVNDGSVVARRNVLHLRGPNVRALDNPATEETDVWFEDGLSWLPALPSASQNNYTISGWDLCTDVLIAPSAPIEITGFGREDASTGAPFVKVKRLWKGNAGANTVTLKHDHADSDAENRILCPGDLDITMSVVNSLVILVFDTSVSRYRAVQCLV